MIFKLLVIVFFISIFYTLGSALFALARGGDSSDNRMVKALTYRVALSLGLFILLMLAYAAGLVAPNPVALTSEKAKVEAHSNQQ